jgi:6-phosphogluconolactonase
MRTFLILLVMTASYAAVTAQSEKEFLYIGTYSVRGSKGIYVYEFNRSKGTAKLIQTIDDLESPSFLAIHPSRKYLYAVNGGSIDGTRSSGSATAYVIDPKTGKLSFLNHISSFGQGPCHISIDKKGEWAFISNYNEGNVVGVSILQDGSLGATMESKKYSGKSVNEKRQEQSHTHSSYFSANNKFLYVSDLGTDKIYTYTFDQKSGKIYSAGVGEIKVTLGAGPRHLALHPTLPYAYSAEELTSTVGIFSIDNTGGMTLVQDTVRSLPKEFKEPNTSADIHTDPQGKFLYLSNRGHDAIAVFSIQQSTGRLKLIGHQKTMGKTPRNFLVDPKGKFLFAANQDSDNITIFKLGQNGMPIFTGKQIKVPSPVCVQYLSLKKK